MRVASLVAAALLAVAPAMAQTLPPVPVPPENPITDAKFVVVVGVHIEFRGCISLGLSEHVLRHVDGNALGNPQRDRVGGARVDFNVVTILLDDEHTGARPGQVLRH